MEYFTVVFTILQCSNTVSWTTEGHPVCWKVLHQQSSMILLLLRNTVPPPAAEHFRLLAHSSGTLYRWRWRWRRHWRSSAGN